MTGGVALLLVSAAVGYWVLERASTQKKDLKTIGQIVGTVIIVVSFAGVLCKTYYLTKWGKGGYYGPARIGCPLGADCPQGPNCPYKSKSSSGK